MTVNDMTKFINKKASYHFNSELAFEVIIKDIKSAYGRDLFLITPVSGSGEKWTNESTIKLIG